MMVTVRTVQYLASRHAGAVLYPGYSWKRTFAKLEVSHFYVANPISCLLTMGEYLFITVA